MVAIVGTYQNGVVKLDKEVSSSSPVKVIVTFLEDVETSTDKVLSLSDFSFSKSQKALEGFSGSFADSLIEERRNEI